MYGATTAVWVPPPHVTNCRLSNYSVVDAYTIQLVLAYIANEQISISDSYVCNMTFQDAIFQCQLLTRGKFLFSAAIFVNSAGVELTVWQKMVRFGGTAAGVLSGGAALLHQSRANSIISFADCQFSLVDPLSIPDHPLQFGF
jgi:hypothetical protein